MEVYDWLSNLDMPSNNIPFQVIEVKYKGARKEFYLNTDNIYLEIGELIAVEGSTGGYDIGHVSLTGELVRTQMKRRKTPLDQVYIVSIEIEFLSCAFEFNFYYLKRYII